ncbi:MAG: hypothetical protein V1709_03125 [Planctomycetota bacterium]
MNTIKLLKPALLTLVVAMMLTGSCNVNNGNDSGSSTPPAPSVTTQDAIDMTLDSATLNGIVNPNGKNVTSCYFRYGLTSGYEKMVFVTPYPGKGTSPVSVSATLSGLLSETTYHFKLAVASSAGTSYGVDKSFKTAKPISLPAQVTSPNPADEASNVSFNPSLSWASASGASSYNVYFGTTTPLVIPAQAGIQTTSYNSGTLSYSTTYYWRIDSKNSIGTTPGILWSFTTQPPQPPTCTTNAATNVTTNSATLNGTVNPNGIDTNAYFQWGQTIPPIELGAIPILYQSTTTSQSIGNGISPISVSANISSLSISTIYNFRIVATNAGGTTNGNNLIFTTGNPGAAPTCTTNVATNITNSSATLNGTVNPNGTATTAYFEYGLTTLYTVIPTAQSIGDGFNSVAVSDTANSLTPNTFYNFRVVGVNASGTTYGNNLTFTTTAVPTTIDDYCWVANFGSDNVTRIQKSDSTTSNIAIGTNPNGVAVDETYCWVTNYNTNNITRINKSDYTTTTIAVGTNPWGVAVDETFCWVANIDSANITRITKSTLATTNITVGLGPVGVAVDETYCWMTNNYNRPGGNSVTRITKSTLATTTIAVGTNPNGIAVDETYCWVAIFGQNIVYLIRKSDLALFSLPVGSGPIGVAVDETYCWVANRNSNNVTRISKSEYTTTTIAVGTNPNGIAVDGTYCWVANRYSNNVTRITKATNATTTIAVGISPYSLGDMTGYAFDNYSRTPAAGSLPTCTTNYATNISSNSATLNGTVNPNGLDVTSCYFDYGTSVSYRSQQSVASLPGSGTSPIPVTANVSSLSAGTLYNFRVVGTNSAGTTYGANQTFTTITDGFTAVDDYNSANTVTRITKATNATTHELRWESVPCRWAI